MPLQTIKISHFRNLGSVDISPSPSLNFLYGSNGSGKTSVLEALSVLAHGRSFRTRKYRRLINQSENEFTVFGRVLEEGRGIASVGVSRSRSGDSRFKVDGVPVTSSAELAERLPLLVVNSESFGLLSGPPKQRRQFFDWLVFHVEHEFRGLWRDYSRCVKQRNSLLRRDKISYSDVRPWDLEIGRISHSIERARAACIDPLVLEYAQIVAGLDKSHGITVAIDYLSGWKDEGDYAAQLEDAFPRDRKLGYTTLGPHKSDLKISVDGLPAGEVLSRGQQKLVISGLYVAEARVFSRATDRGCVFLVDDMPAELDAQNMQLVGQWISDTQAQVFVTSVEYQPVFGAWPDQELKTSKVFHVEHGGVTETLFDTPGGVE